jgi:hypothetical protein
MSRGWPSSSLSHLSGLPGSDGEVVDKFTRMSGLSWTRTSSTGLSWGTTPIPATDRPSSERENPADAVRSRAYGTDGGIAVLTTTKRPAPGAAPPAPRFGTTSPWAVRSPHSSFCGTTSTSGTSYRTGRWINTSPMTGIRRLPPVEVGGGIPGFLQEYLIAWYFLLQLQGSRELNVRTYPSSTYHCLVHLQRRHYVTGRV